MSKSKTLVILESPFKGSTLVKESLHLTYLDRVLRDSLFKGEAPFASHRMYTAALSDSIQSERRLGMEAGFAWLSCAEKLVVYTDYGISSGMKAGIKRATDLHINIEFRSIGLNPASISKLADTALCTLVSESTDDTPHRNASLFPPEKEFSNDT